MRASLRKIKNLAALPRAERRLVIEAAGTLPVIALGLRLLRMSVLFRSLDRLAARLAAPSRSDEVPVTIRRTRRALTLAAWRGFYRGNCLSRSATLWWLLRRQGVRSDLRIGVRKEDGQLQAHAWVECDGVALNERAETLRRYAPFAERVTP